MITNNDLHFAQYKLNSYIGQENLLARSIVRYTSLRNLHSMLKGSLYTTRRNNFEDKREQGIVKQTKNAFRLQIADGFNKKYWRQFDEKAKYSRELLTSCWSTSIIEDALMWKSFNAEIRIKTTPKKIFDAILDPDINISICDQIKYAPEHPIYTLRDALFYKELSYRNEQEIRFYFDKGPNGYQGISINPNNLIDEVLISPFINNKVQNLLKNIKEEFAYLSFRESMIIEKQHHENKIN